MEKPRDEKPSLGFLLGTAEFHFGFQIHAGQNPHAEKHSSDGPARPIAEL